MPYIDNRRLLILLILFASLFLRTYGLGDESIWLDEGESVRFASNSSVSEIFFLREYNPPLYYIILHWWIKLFGDSEFSIRFTAFIFGFLSLLMIYKVGNQIFHNDSGIFSAFILGLSLFHISYSQEARTYTLSTLLTLLSMYFFVMIINRMKLYNIVGYILFSSLLMYSHIYGSFIILCQDIYYGILFFLSREHDKLNLKKWAFIQGIIIIIFLPWVRIFSDQVNIVQKGYWIPRATKYDLLILFSGYSQDSYWLLLIFLILSLLTFIKYEKLSGRIDWSNFFKSIENFRWKVCLFNIDKVILLFIWLLVPILIPFVISQFSTPIFISRYTIMASLAFYLLVGNGINSLKNRYNKYVIITLIIIFSILPLKDYYAKDQKPQWKDIVNYIEKNAVKEDILLLHWVDKYIFNYYLRRSSIKNKLFIKETPDINEENISELIQSIAGYNRVWVISYRSGDSKGLITQKLSENYNLSYQKEYSGKNLYRFESARSQGNTPW